MAITITCPVCGRRNLYEFRFGGEERGPRPDEEGLTQSGLVRIRPPAIQCWRTAAGMVEPPGWMRPVVHHLA